MWNVSKIEKVSYEVKNKVFINWYIDFDVRGMSGFFPSWIKNKIGTSLFLFTNKVYCSANRQWAALCLLTFLQEKAESFISDKAMEVSIIFFRVGVF